MQRTQTQVLLLVLPVFFAVSCKDDPELIRKRDEQRLEIGKLEAELAVLDDRLDNAPEDRSEELKALRERTEQNRTEIAELEKELADLSAKRRAMEGEFSSYKAKYPLK